jgi:DNA-binding ferritin-like protein
MNAKAPLIDIGISAAEREKIAHGLSALLADSYTLYLMTHNFHWNVTGPQFNSLHLMFMGQYTEQWTALDIIAERIRALGYPAPGTYKEFVALASVKEVWTSPRGVEGSLRNPDTSGGRYGRKANPATVYGSLQGASGQTGGGGRPRAVRGGH